MKRLMFAILILFVSVCSSSAEYSGSASLSFTEYTAQNGSNITLTGAGWTNIVSLPQFSVKLGDKIIINAVSIVNKWATGGNTDIQVFQSAGTGALLSYHLAADFQVNRDQPANANERFKPAGIFRIQTAGTVTITMRGQSAGSDGVVNTPLGQIYALHISRSTTS